MNFRKIKSSVILESIITIILYLLIFIDKRICWLYYLLIRFLKYSIYISLYFPLI